MALKDYYKILGIEFNAQENEIRKAYHKKAQKFHPDKNKSKSAPKRFQDVKEAYETLNNHEKRTKYDLSYKKGKKQKPNKVKYSSSKVNNEEIKRTQTFNRYRNYKYKEKEPNISIGVYIVLGIIFFLIIVIIVSIVSGVFDPP